MYQLKLPTGFLDEWVARANWVLKPLGQTARTVTVAMDAIDLDNLISDALAASEAGQATAKTLLKSLEDQGVTWSRRPGTFQVVTHAAPQPKAQ